MAEFEICAVSGIDGRYGQKTKCISAHVSECALIKARVEVEISWLKWLIKSKIVQVRKMCIEPSDSQIHLSQAQISSLDSIHTELSVKEGLRVKEIEKVTNHDVKAVEYYIKERMTENADTKEYIEYVHILCTSEDINNVAYALNMKRMITFVIKPKFESFVSSLCALAHSTASIPLLALTHGQPATPSTFGREMGVYHHRLSRQLDNLNNLKFLAKFNGATGSFNAHYLTYPSVNWEAECRQFIESFGLDYNPMTTQIENHDYISEFSDLFCRISNILIGFCRDIWMYISRGVLVQIPVQGEVGSSTMPHKINPIDFENSEGNFELAVSSFTLLSQKLVKSRLQRDLSDSTVLRSLGVAFGYFVIGIDSLSRGLVKIHVNEALCRAELESNWSLLAEPIQCVMRKNGVERPYEKLKEFTRGKEVGVKEIREFIETLEGEIDPDDFQRLIQLTPEEYTGIGKKLVEKYC
jgi:adenylosuccinate lyase